MSVDEHLIPVCSVFFPAINTSFEERSICLVIGSATPFFVHLRKWSRITAQYVWSSDVPWRWTSSDFFGNSTLNEWLNDLAAFPNCNLSVLFLYGCQAAKILSKSAEICSPICFFWTAISTLRVDFAAYVFFDDSCCAWSLLSAVSVQLFLVMCYAKRFPSAARGRIDSFSWETAARRYILLFRTFLDPSFEVDDLCEELGRNCVVAQDTPVRCLIEFQRVLRCFQINHRQSVMMVLHVELRTCTSGRGSDPMAIRVRNTLLFCLCFFQILLTQVLTTDFIESSCLENTAYETTMMRLLSRKMLGESVDMYTFSPEWHVALWHVHMVVAHWKLVWLLLM